MTVYYSAQTPIYKSLTTFHNTVFGAVFKRPEFWVFLFLHCVLVVLTMTGIVDSAEMGEFRWEAASVMQFFMTFFLTFYNGHCFSRYEKLYYGCMELIDGVLLFVHEMIVAMPQKELELHRITATKYILATVYVFFMGVTGGALSRNEWREIVKKGLLTRAEAEQLANFPGGQRQVPLVLTSWTMQVVDLALRDECLWGARSMRIAHTHNRLNGHIIEFLKGTHRIGNMLALPIPFPYYHVMNAILLLNFLLIGVVMAFFKTYMTVFPYGVTLVIFMGLRECACSLADPFGTDDVDFPVAAFMDYTFDHAVCLLEAFGSADRHHILQRVREHADESFTDAQIMRACRATILYDKSYDPARGNPFSWSREMPLQNLTTENPCDQLRDALVNVEKYIKPEDESDDESEEEKKGWGFGFSFGGKKDKEEDKDEEQTAAEKLKIQMGVVEKQIKHLETEVEEMQIRVDCLKSVQDSVADWTAGSKPNFDDIMSPLEMRARSKDTAEKDDEGRLPSDFESFDQARLTIRQALQETAPRRTPHR